MKKSWKQVLRERSRDHFVGRAEPLRQLSENFGDEPNYLVFSITGEGGVGKTTLLQRFASIASGPSIDAIVAACDDRQLLPAGAMEHIARELAKHNVRHKELDERLKKYHELKDEIERDPKAPRGAVDLLARGVSHLAIKSGSSVPVVGAFLDGVDDKATGERLAELINYGIDRWGNKDEVLLLRETERVLTPLFLKLVALASEKRKLVLMFDVLERTGQTLGPWLLSLLRFEYGELDTNVSFVLAGRERLEQHWTEFSHCIHHVALEPFLAEETSAFLANKGISDERLANQIHADTCGLPVLVDLLAAASPSPGAPLPDVSQDAVERFLMWISQPERRTTSLLAAVPPSFTRSILAAAIGGNIDESYSWITNQSFVRRDGERGYRYHDKVRNLMLRHLHRTDPETLAASRQRLLEHVTREQSNLKLEGKRAYASEEWRTLECARVYCLASLGSSSRLAVVEAFLGAFRWRWGFTEDIARACASTASDAPNDDMHRLACTLSDTHHAYDKELSKLGIDSLRQLQSIAGLSASARATIHVRWTWFLYVEDRHDEAIEVLDRACRV